MIQPICEPIAKQSYTAEAIQAWIVSQLCEQLGVEPNDIDVREPFDSYGLDSVQEMVLAMVLASKAEKLLGFRLSPILLWHYPTIEALAQHLVEESEVSRSEFFEI